MAQIRCEVVTAERIVFDDDVDVVVAPGVEGQLGILPHHA
ncbi:MAG: F0F1 ATP synthase subunit epsilon, partial [Anaerolineae bacterium]